MSRHVCECPSQPDCEPHGAIEWGGGEPDVCSPHDHQGADEAKVRLAIGMLMDRLEPAERTLFLQILRALGGSE